MMTYVRNPLVYIWAFLALITIASWRLSLGGGAEFRINPTITVGILFIALIKSRLVIRYFMEVRTAPTWLRRTCDGWLIVLFGAIAAIYYFSV